SGEIDAHQLVGPVVAIAADDKMHDALACQPSESCRREHHELAHLAGGNADDQEGQSADRHGQRHALQDAARHHPPAHHHVVKREGERTESSVKDTEQETFPPASLSSITFAVSSWPIQQTVNQLAAQASPPLS